MTFNKEVVDKFLDAVFPLPEEFGLNISDEDGDAELDDFDGLQYEIKKIDPEASLCFGMTKLVITAPILNNVVIKIPFNGINHVHDIENDDDPFIEWKEFYYAPGSDPTDYCLAEYEKYNDLKNSGLERFVAETAIYENDNRYVNKSVYIQEEVTPIRIMCKCPQPSQRSKKLAKEWNEQYKIDGNVEWYASCIDSYTEEKVESFLSYCEKIDGDILEDLHGMNFGYRATDESPCILDYSNFLD